MDSFFKTTNQMHPLRVAESCEVAFNRLPLQVKQLAIYPPALSAGESAGWHRFSADGCEYAWRYIENGFKAIYAIDVHGLSLYSVFTPREVALFESAPPA